VPVPDVQSPTSNAAIIPQRPAEKDRPATAQALLRDLEKR
jgi:hypothetical protein